MNQHDDVTIGSSNIYADLGFDEPDLEAVKATFARAIRDQIKARGITQAEAGKLLGISQGDVSRIVRGRLGAYSTERLLTLLTRLNLDIEISIAPNTSQRATGRISAATSQLQPSSASGA